MKEFVNAHLTKDGRKDIGDVLESPQWRTAAIDKEFAPIYKKRVF
jgi:hypothetical protein